MLYLIGGASRAGKTTIAQRLLAERHAPFLPLDALMMGIANGLPQIGVQPNDPEPIVGAKLWPLLRALAINLLEENYDYCLEGAQLLPTHAAELRERWGAAVRSCFVGYATVDPARKRAEIRRYADAPNNWVRQLDDAELDALIIEMRDYSAFLRDSCARLGLPYVDASTDFPAAAEQVYATLTRV